MARSLKFPASGDDLQDLCLFRKLQPEISQSFGSPSGLLTDSKAANQLRINMMDADRAGELARVVESSRILPHPKSACYLRWSPPSAVEDHQQA
jgi:hypothetical protein